VGKFELSQLSAQPFTAIRVPHGYGNTHGISKTGNVGTGMVLDFGTPCTCTAVSRVFTG